MYILRDPLKAQLRLRQTSMLLSISEIHDMVLGGFLLIRVWIVLDL